MAFKKGEGGRPKGTKNKATKALKEMILAALDESGGVEYLKKRAKDNPVAFLTLVGKVLPLQVSGPDGSAIPIKHIVNNYATPAPLVDRAPTR